MKNIKATAIILAGGKSSRLKETLQKYDLENAGKPFLKLGNNFIIESIIKKIQSIFEDILVVTSKAKFKITNQIINQSNKKLKIIKDIIPDKNSIGGIYTGLVNSKNFINFVIGGDMPFIKPELIKFMLGEINKSKHDVVIPEIKNIKQPLFAIYTKNCIGVIKDQIFKKNLKLIDVLKKINFLILNEKIIQKYDDTFLSFFNVNTNFEYIKAKDIYTKEVI